MVDLDYCETGEEKKTQFEFHVTNGGFGKHCHE